MAFAPEQITELAALLSAGAVKQRKQAGRQLSYIEGWHAIAEANRIFGFDGWTRETGECRMVAERPRKIGAEPNIRDGWCVSYVARVKVVVFAGDSLVTREGIGAGHGIDVDLGLAHESAVKEAETDAMKRALMTFGNPFGLALYDKTQEGVEAQPGRAAGGHARAAALPPERRAEIASNAAKARWDGQEPRPASSQPPRQEARPEKDMASPDGIRVRMLAAIGKCQSHEEMETLTEGRAWKEAFEPLPEPHKVTIRAAITKRFDDLTRMPA